MEPHSVLLVDDEVNNLNALERVLRREYIVFSTTSGEEAISVMEQNDIDLIIADHRMPGMTGAELLEKTLEKYPNTIRVILTAYTDQKLLLDAINRVQAHAFLTKPWDSEQVEFTVRRWIEVCETIDELGRKAEQSENLQKQLEEARKAADEARQMVTELTHRVEQSQRLLEYYKKPFWRRWSKSKKETTGNNGGYMNKDY